ncbi:MAG: MFS transporter [Clostridiales bacterium]|jgi:GPH family glycoside/pentoside/hexuronide:cation symporter|nr:MFS transporter [Clostridiales bacterium]
MKTTEKVQPTSPLRYAAGMFGTSIPINMFKTYAAIFYVDRLGLTMPQYSLILLIYTFLDALDNPVYGFLSDCTRTRWGRRRPWLVIGAPLLALCFVMFYNVPAGLGQGSLFWYMLIMYMLTGTLDSLINANYGALFPELFKTETVRAKTNAMRQAFQLAAMVISIALTPIVTEALGYSLTALIYGALAVVVIVFMAVGCHEDPVASSKPKPQLLKTIADIAANPKFWLYGVTNAAFTAGQSVLLSAVPFFVQYTLGGGGAGATIMQGTVILIAIGGIFVWVRVIRRVSLMPAWRASLAVLALGFIPLYFTNTLLTSTLVLVIFGFGIAGALTTMDLVGARILDEDAARHGIQREGTFSSLVGVLNKFSGLFISLAFFLASSIYGYKSGNETGPTPGDAARFLMVIFPFAAMVCCFCLSFLVRFNPQDKEPGDKVSKV